MNRSILIVICDFLLVSLLTFSSLDINQAPGPRATAGIKVDIATNAPNQAETGKDLAEVMKLALQEERQGRNQLQAELAKALDSADAREKQVESAQKEIASRSQEAQKLSQQQTLLQQQLTAAQANIQTLSQQAQSSTAQNVVSQEKLAAVEAELRKRVEEASALQQQMSALEKSNLLALNEKQRLAGQLQVAEAEKRSASEQAARLQEVVKVQEEANVRLTEHAEKLAEGVKTLASKSGEIAKEMRENRSLAPNNIFSEFLSNRVEAQFSASKAGAFGIESAKRRDTETVLISDGTNIYAMCHIQDTPLTLWDPGTDWAGLAGTLQRGTVQMAINSLRFHLQDPRIVLMPVTAAQARQLGCSIYHISNDPYKFQDAVLVGAREGYYGECKFQIDLNTPEYVKLDRSFIKGLFGKFNPSRGDLVFSKNNELLGVMANNTYCFMVHNFDASASMQFGDVRSQHTGDMLARLYSYVFQMPNRLQ